MNMEGSAWTEALLIASPCLAPGADEAGQGVGRPAGGLEVED